MKLLLIQSSHLNDDGSVFKSRRLMYPGLALPIIAALTPSNFEIEIRNDYFQEIDYEAPVDLVGISAMTTQAPRAYQIAGQFKKRGVPVVMGGFHPSLYPDETAEYCDAVAIGEGEPIWLMIIEDFLKGPAHLKKQYRAKGLADLDHLPTPRYDLLDMSGYPLKAYPVQTTRGCPRRCDFCSVRVFYGNRYRYRPIANVVRDVQATGSRRIFFIDDNIASGDDRFIELCQALEPLKLIWGSQCNVEVGLKPQLLEAAARAGCFSLFLGVESIDPEILKSVKKGFNDVKQYAEAFANLRRADIMPMVSMILGLDGDDQSVFDRNIKFLIDNKIPIAYVFILAPVPGTEFFRRWKEEGRLTSFDWTQYSGEHVVFKPGFMTPDQLKTGMWKVYREFYRPRSIFKRLSWPLPVTRSRLVALKFNLLHWRSVRQGIHPLRG